MSYRSYRVWRSDFERWLADSKTNRNRVEWMIFSKFSKILELKIKIWMHDNDKTMTSMKHNGKPIIDDEGIFSISSPNGQSSFSKSFRYHQKYRLVISSVVYQSVFVFSHRICKSRYPFFIIYFVSLPWKENWPLYLTRIGPSRNLAMSPFFIKKLYQRFGWVILSFDTVWSFDYISGWHNILP